jgi:hypothetical protein
MPDLWPRTRRGRELLAEVAARIAQAEEELEPQERAQAPRFSEAEARMLRARGVTLAQAEAALRSSGE